MIVPVCHVRTSHNNVMSQLSDWKRANMCTENVRTCTCVVEGYTAASQYLLVLLLIRCVTACLPSCACFRQTGLSSCSLYWQYVVSRDVFSADNAHEFPRCCTWPMSACVSSRFWDNVIFEHVYVQYDVRSYQCCIQYLSYHTIGRYQYKWCQVVLNPAANWRLVLYVVVTSYVYSSIN